MTQAEEEYLIRKHDLSFKALCEVDRILNESSISYYLLAGSVLGAVRHGGFIPWDDDIDIGILYKDINEVANLLIKNLQFGFTYIDKSVDEKYPRLYGKVMFEDDACIDIFPLVKTSNNIVGRTIQWASRKVLFKLYKGKLGYSNHNENVNAFEKSKVLLASIISTIFSRQRIEKLVAINEMRFEQRNDNKYYINLYSAYSMEKELIKTEWLFPKGIIQFNGKEFTTVNCCNQYLTHLYGNYIELPPLEKRHPRHEEKF